MRQIVFILITFCYLSCKTVKMNEELKNDRLLISYLELKELSPDKCNSIKILFLFDPEEVLISRDGNDPVIAREGPYGHALLALKKFKKLEELYFLNIYMTNIPEGIMEVKKLEILHFSFLNHFTPETQISKLVRLKRLKKLMINTSFIEERDFITLKNGLPKVEVISD
jgi:hypothetical protein